jgi:large subunit ribosomal protein L27
VGRGKDDTLFATADGSVKFGARHGRRLVDILPADGSVANGGSSGPLEG